MNIDNILSSTLTITVMSGFVAALVSIHYQEQTAKKTLAITLVQLYIEKKTLRAHAAWVFDQCKSHSSSKCINPATCEPAEETKTSENLNLLIQLGDWFEVVAALYLTGSLNKTLVKRTGLLKEVKTFRRNILSLEKEQKSSFQRFWPNLCSICLKFR